LTLELIDAPQVLQHQGDGEQVEVEIRQIMELEDLPVSPERVAEKKQREQSKR